MFSRCRVILPAALLGALLLSTSLAAQAGDSDVGTFCLAGVREVGSCIRLTEDGRFEYFLTYGAYDETSEGRWRDDGAAIVLQSEAYQRQPQFRFKQQRAASGDAYEIIVVGKSGDGIAGIDVRVSCGSATSEGYTQSYGFRTDCTSPPHTVELGVAMLQLDFQSTQLPQPAGGEKAYIFEFEPGDLGRKSFQGVRLKREGRDALILQYQDTPVNELAGRLFRYQRQ